MSEEMMQGQLISGVGSLYTAETEDGQRYSLRCKRRFRHMHISPLVGDMILFSPGALEEDGWIEEILPRKSQCIRPPVANVELMCIVASPVPEPDYLLIDRLLVQCRQQNMEPVIVVSKSDLSHDVMQEIAEQYISAEARIFQVSGETAEGVDKLRQYLCESGKLCCFTGQSGVGKSTLINKLLNLELETGEISRKIQRGKNTTRTTTLIRKDGISLLDTAGFSLLEFEDTMNPEELMDFYPEFREYEGKCKFSTCLHGGEKGCMVKAAVDAGKISGERYRRYITLLAETQEKWRKRYD